MGENAKAYRTELEDFLAVLELPDEEGLPFIIVGGHAANFWALQYLPKKPSLQEFFPFTPNALNWRRIVPEYVRNLNLDAETRANLRQFHTD
jgi:hypothetical protein